MQNIAKCCCVTNVEANLQPDFFVAVSGLVFMPDYMDLCNGGVACQGKDSPSVWLTDSRFTWAAKPAAKKQRTAGPIESLALLSTECHRSSHENLDDKRPQNIQPMLGALEMQKKKNPKKWQELAETLNSRIWGNGGELPDQFSDPGQVSGPRIKSDFFFMYQFQNSTWKR